MLPGWLRQIAGLGTALRSDARRAADRRRLGVGEADQARAQHAWPKAISLYEHYLSQRSNDLGVRIRLIQAYAASGQFVRARQAVTAALQERPDSKRLKAVAEDFALETRNAPQGMEQYLLHDRERQAWTPMAPAFDAFRQAHPAPQPPPHPLGDADAEEVICIIDGRGTAPATIDNTLDSLRCQSHWRAIVAVDDPADHDARRPAWNCDGEFEFVRGDGEDRTVSGVVLVLQPGTILDPNALAWLRVGLSYDGVTAVYADHDLRLERVGQADIYFNPALQSAPQSLDLDTNARPPLVLLERVFAMPLAACLDRSARPDARRRRLCEMADVGAAVHIPLLLSTLPSAPSADPMAPGLDWADSGPPIARSRSLSKARILVVVPTRDQASALSAMVTSFTSLAHDRASIDIVVVDNGSVEPQTEALLTHWRNKPGFGVIRDASAFNWSSLNNLAVEGGDQDILVFANNDVEMLTRGWDAQLRDSLAEPNTGVVGARLLYPSGTIQHAGISLGALAGAPLHEGLGEDGDQGGPLSRWSRLRPAAALTGAFLAVRRTVFEHLGGFEDAFPVSCNDVDFCLKVRDAGLLTVYDPSLSLIHHESLTRGHDPSSDAGVALQADLDRLFARWGEYARWDPYRNPQWAAYKTRLFQWLKSSTADDVVAWMDNQRRFPAEGMRESRPTPSSDPDHRG